MKKRTPRLLLKITMIQNLLDRVNDRYFVFLQHIKSVPNQHIILHFLMEIPINLRQILTTFGKMNTLYIVTVFEANLRLE